LVCTLVTLGNGLKRSHDFKMVQHILIHMKWMKGL